MGFLGLAKKSKESILHKVIERQGIVVGYLVDRWNSFE